MKKIPGKNKILKDPDLAIILALMHEPLVILDMDLAIKSANQSFYKAFSTNEKEAVGTLFYHLGNQQWATPELRRLLQNVVTENTMIENFGISTNFPAIGEKVMLLNAQKIVQRSEEGQLILLAINDITERVMLQRHEKEKLTGTIKENKIQNKKGINEELQAFSFVSSHDLQEPLRKIQILTTMILQNEHHTLSESGKDYFDRIQGSAKRMRSLIKDLIAYTKINGSDHPFKMTDLTVIIEEVKKEFEEIIQEKEAKIEVNMAGPVKVIPVQFRQLFHNLLSNALKFSKPGKKPHISITSIFEKTTLLNLNKKDTSEVNCCIITVSDNGIGFAKKHAEKIFTVFQKLHSKDEYEGTGIGLAIVKKIVLIHRGIISAESTAGKKTTFTIILPVEWL